MLPFLFMMAVIPWLLLFLLAIFIGFLMQLIRALLL